MKESIIIDTQLYPDEEYEPLRRTLAKMLTKPETLKVYADLIRHECKMHGECQSCVFYDKDENNPTCVLTYRAPEAWPLEHLSQLNDEGVKK